MAGGRPTKLTPELIEKAKGYLGTCFTNPVMTDKGALAYAEVNLPMVVGLAIYLNISKETVYAWCRDSVDNTPEMLSMKSQFSDIVKEINTEQEKWLVNYTAGGLYQPKLAGMMLSKHGYAEKTETDITTKGEKIDSFDTKALAIAKKFEDELKKDL